MEDKSVNILTAAVQVPTSFWQIVITCHKMQHTQIILCCDLFLVIVGEVFWRGLFFAASERMIQGEVDTVIRPLIWQPETWNLWFYLQEEREKSQGRGGGGCFSRPEVCLSQRLLPRHVDHFHPPCVLPPCLILSPTKSSTYHKHLNSWTNMWPSESPPRRYNLLSEKFEEHTS